MVDFTFSHLIFKPIKQPGFKVYRHLKCSVFSEDVQTPEDVGGWKKLKKEDYNALVERVEESKEEIKKEMEELDPDELVPVTFQGEMRPAPPGLTADLLPFQVEGVSWMYHQELEEESGVRGGMLCDEVRTWLLCIDKW
jgi:SNF2 family DNA or RNA helicase